MPFNEHVPIGAPLTAYEDKASQLFDAHARGDAAAIAVLHNTLPQFLDPVVKWKPLPIPDDEIRATKLTIEDAQLAVARAHSFRNWAALETFAEHMATQTSVMRAFELAAEAVIDGDTLALGAMIAADPLLVHARSERECCHDPCVHRATLLHYLAANGIEGYRQRTPANAVEIARMLLDAGADVDALADMYGGKCTPLSMLVSSSHPAEAGVQVELVNTLLDYGASIDGNGEGEWVSPIRTALIFGFRDAAEAVASRATSIDDLVIAAGLGRMDDCRRLLASATPEAKHEALAIATINRQLDVVRMLLDDGVDPNRLNPPGMHAHQTPLHGAAVDGDLAMVELLVSHGARSDIADGLWNATAVGWAEHGGHQEVIDWFAARGAKEGETISAGSSGSRGQST